MPSRRNKQAAQPFGILVVDIQKLGRTFLFTNDPETPCLVTFMSRHWSSEEIEDAKRHFMECPREDRMGYYRRYKAETEDLYDKYLEMYDRTREQHMKAIKSWLPKGGSDA